MLLTASLVLVPAALGVHFLLDVAPAWTFIAGIVAIVRWPNGTINGPSRIRKCRGCGLACQVRGRFRHIEVRAPAPAPSRRR